MKINKKYIILTPIVLIIILLSVSFCLSYSYHVKEIERIKCSNITKSIKDKSIDTSTNNEEINVQENNPQDSAKETTWCDSSDNNEEGYDFTLDYYDSDKFTNQTLYPKYSIKDDFYISEIQYEREYNSPQNYLFIPKYEKNIMVPAFISDYDFILMANTTGTDYQYFLLEDGTLSDAFFKKMKKYSTNNLQGYIYEGQNGYWFKSDTLQSKHNKREVATIYVHSKNEKQLSKLIKIASNYKEVKNGYYYSAGYSELFNYVNRRKREPNETDPYNDYEYYLPEGYNYVLNDYEFVYENDDINAKFCMELRRKEYLDISCDFLSTSGCTCCNSGCGLVDIVLLSSRSGKLYLEPVLQKGNSENLSVSSIAFTYDSSIYDNPWLLYSQHIIIESPKKLDEYKNVLDFVYMIDSLDRLY